MHESSADERHLVTKSNNLLEARYRLTVNQQKVIAVMASQIAPTDEDFKPYRISVSELEVLLGVKNNSFHGELRALTKNLVERCVVIKKPRGELQVSWLSSAEYRDGEGVVELSFDPKLKPYLLQLKERFTSYRLAAIVQLKSTYSVRIYELLKQYENIGKRTFELADLRHKLGFEKHEYKRWQDLRRRVLEPAAKELPEKTDISFSYKTRKKGRKIWWLDFDIRPGKKAGQPIKTELSQLRAKASKCWNNNGTCAAEWDNHKSPVDACHHCRKFEKKRAEAAGQLPLLS